MVQEFEVKEYKWFGEKTAPKAWFLDFVIILINSADRVCTSHTLFPKCESIGECRRSSTPACDVGLSPSGDCHVVFRDQHAKVV